MTDFYTADTHFGHRMLVETGKRPWQTVDEMDEALINDWNATVNPKDRVFVIGDFSFYGRDKTPAILRRLRGQKFLVRGNHDSSKTVKSCAGHWGWVRHHHVNRVDGESIVLSHCPYLSWPGMHHGHYHLHGHCHGHLRLPDTLQNARILDVGVDATVAWTGSYRPVAWEEVRERLKDCTASSVDGHKVKSYGN